MKMKIKKETTLKSNSELKIYQSAFANNFNYKLKILLHF